MEILVPGMRSSAGKRLVGVNSRENGVSRIGGSEYKPFFQSVMVKRTREK